MFLAALCGSTAPAALASTDSTVAPAQSASLPVGHGIYVFVASSAGEAPIGSISWSEGQDLAVEAPGTSNQAISIGHSSAHAGSFVTTSTSAAITGVGLDGYTVVQSFSMRHSKPAHKATRTPEKPIRGASLTLPFSTTAGELVLVAAGGQGTGTLELSSIEATTLENATYGGPGSAVISSAALFTAQLPAGKHRLKLRSTTFAPNAGTSLGAVAYVLAPSPAPTVASVAPGTGPETGGTLVQITGTDLDGATAVKFGSSSAQSFKVNSPTSVEAVAPAGAGSVDVTVATERGTSATGAADSFNYLPPPSVSGVSPNSGPESGATTVTIAGANLAGATAVKFGSANAQSFKVNSPTSIEAVAPSGSGTVDVTVIGPYGTSTATSADRFSYLAPYITASKGGPFRGGYELSIQVHNFPTGTFIYYCHDNSGPGGSDTIYFSHAVEVTNPNQSSWPGVFCYDSAPYVSYLVMDGVRSNSVQF